MDTTKRIEELYLAFAKSQSQIDELYKKLPVLNWSRPNPAITTQIQTQRQATNTKEDFAKLDLDRKEMEFMMNRMVESDLKFIELEKMGIALTKKFWEEKIIPSIPSIERIITETECCETILTDIEALNELETSGLLRQVPNAELEKKRIEWVSFIHKIKDRIKPQLISDDDINTMDENIILLENSLEYEKNKYENKMALKTELETSYLTQPYPAVKEAIATATNHTHGRKIGMERTELMIEHKKIKKMYFSGFKDYIQNLNNCIDKSIEKHGINCDIHPKSFHIIS
jgi:hypothetical protein